MSEQAIVTRRYDFVKKNENNFVMQYCFDSFSENQLFLQDRSEIEAKLTGSSCCKYYNFVDDCKLCTAHRPAQDL